MSDCIEWDKARGWTGYGHRYFQGKVRRAHRVAYIEHHGLALEDIEGLVVMHTCDNPPCVNVDHLRLGTVANNNEDTVAKGRQRHPVGTEHGMAKLTEAEVLAIRFLHAAAGTSKNQLARTFNVAHSTVSDIITRKKWKHL